MWYYAEDGQQKGPVSDADLDALWREGKITPQTLVWREGMADWQPLRQVKTVAPDAGGGLVCAECGKVFQPDQVIRVNDRWVCATCKPIFVQRMTEGSSSGGRTTLGLVSEAQVRERDYEHDIGGYLSEAWQLYKTDPGGLIVATLLAGLCIVAAMFIPYLNIITNIVFTGPLWGGLYGFYLKKIRGQAAALGDAFGGFGPRFGQLLLAKFIPNLMAGLALIPVGLIFAVVMVSSMAARNHGGTPGLMLGAPMMIAIALAVAGICVMVYFQVCWIFTLWLVRDKNMTFWPAMSLSRAVVRKHWWRTWWMGVVTGVLAGLGILLCFIGALFTVPLALAVWARAYERLFGDLQPE